MRPRKRPIRCRPPTSAARSRISARPSPRQLPKQNGKLATMSTKITPLAVSRLRREIRENEEECRQLDHMIEAIDRRFSSQWASLL
jgi:hypothetical protein